MLGWMRKSLLTLTVLAAASLALSGCGRKGDPEMKGITMQTTKNGTKKPQVEDKPFFLDPLL
jgi:predicted small lipoprotein YifL